MVFLYHNLESPVRRTLTRLSTDSGNTALHLASEAGHLSVVKYLVEREDDDVNSLNYDNETPLHLAAQKGRQYLVKYFLKNGCNVNTASANSSTSLHVAC